jgi:transcriptional regulator with XRE-family HTH domain
MILSDLLAYLRARRDGLFYSDVAEATGISTLRLVRAERTFANPDLTPDEIERLARYFEVPAEELRTAQRQARGDLTSYLARQEKSSQPVRLRLLGGAEVSGPLVWRDRHAVALRQPDKTTLVVYRSSVEGWGD